MNELSATRAKLKCLEMVEGTNLNWKQLVRFKDTQHTITREIIDYEGDSLEFAIHIIEGKPVFKGDELFMDGEKKIVVAKHPNCDSLQWMKPSVFTELGITLVGMPAKHWSWNPSKHKTVMVELPIEIARTYANNYNCAVGNACRKALNNLEQPK